MITDNTFLTFAHVRVQSDEGIPVMTRSRTLSSAIVCALALFGVAPAPANGETVDLGDTADIDLVDIEGASDAENAADLEIDQLWTIADLRPSTDAIPYRVVGTLWEATATAALEDGGVPVIPGFFARSDSGSYPVLWNVPSDLGVSPAALPPAGSVTGKFYFDVTGPTPTSVAYLDSEGELIEWQTPSG